MVICMYLYSDQGAHAMAKCLFENYIGRELRGTADHDGCLERASRWIAHFPIQFSKFPISSL